jgi:hypothetical protein
MSIFNPDSGSLEGGEISGGVTFSLSEDARSIARELSAEESNVHSERPFLDMIGAVRFAISLGIYTYDEGEPPTVSSAGKTMFNLGSLDPNGIYRKTLEALCPELLKSEPLARLLRRYAEAGLQIMQRHHAEHDGSFNAIKLIEVTKQAQV